VLNRTRDFTKDPTERDALARDIEIEIAAFILEKVKKTSHDNDIRVTKRPWGNGFGSRASTF